MGWSIEALGDTPSPMGWSIDFPEFCRGHAQLGGQSSIFGMLHTDMLVGSLSSGDVLLFLLHFAWFLAVIRTKDS